jgi:hypothetical protein
MREENEYSLGLTTVIDKTTDPLYVFTSVTLNPDADEAAKEWVCYRTTVASGNKKFAKHPVKLTRVATFDQKEKLLQASLAATYAY